MLVASKHGGRLIRLELYKNKKAIFHDKAKSKSKLLGGGGGVEDSTKKFRPFRIELSGNWQLMGL